jgi:hypothetical protein
MNNRTLGAIVGVLILAVSLIFILKRREPGERPKETVVVEPVVNIFHPDSVVGFRWKTKSKTFNFARKNRNDSWSPSVNPQDIQERLNLVAAANYKKIEKSGIPLVEITVAFGEKIQWTGAWDGTNFFWQNGNFEGQGFQPKNQQIVKFEAGRFAFEKDDLNWCPQRIKALEVISGPLKFQLRQHGLKWIVDTKEVDPTFVEQWFGRACTNKLEEYLDAEVSPERHWDGLFKVKFSDGKSLEWKKESQGPAFNDGTRTFVSTTLTTHLEELSRAPVIGEAPPPSEEPPPTPVARKEISKKKK